MSFIILFLYLHLSTILFDSFTLFLKPVSNFMGISLLFFLFTFWFFIRFCTFLLWFFTFLFIKIYVLSFITIPVILLIRIRLIFEKDILWRILFLFIILTVLVTTLIFLFFLVHLVYIIINRPTFTVKILPFTTKFIISF